MKQPLVIGVGGLLEKDENGRIQEMLSAMEKRGCVTYAHVFRTICRDGNRIICPVNGGWIDDIKEVIRPAMEDEHVDQKRVGFIASSLGATFLDYFLASDETLTDKSKPYASIAPYAKVNGGVVAHIKRMIERKIDLDVSSPHDTERGIKRIIPSSCLEMVLDIDVPKVLTQRQKPYSIMPLTILGLKDDRADNEAIRKRHKILNGREQDLIELDCGHNIPQELIQERILQFMYSNLGLGQSMAA
ncbi:MAG: hypothetical protein AABW89_02085 [Nanoarchaeota archaeon]